MRKHIICGIATLIFIPLWYYKTTPALNIHSEGLWFFAITVAIFYGIVESIINRKEQGGFQKKQNNRKFRVASYKRSNDNYEMSLIKGMFKVNGYIVAFVIFVLMFVISFFAEDKIFFSKKYSELITVTESDVSAIPSVEGTSSIALMDTSSAEKLGDREIGALSNVVSQYDVAGYTQIDYQGSPIKVAPLRYAGFFKWLKNKDAGIPGYVTVDPVKMDADYVALDEGMKYVPSARFSQNLKRHVRFAYPTTIFSNGHFEIDEEGTPWYVYSVYEQQFGLFDGKQVTGCILVNPFNGEMQKLSLDEVPTWVDVVFDGDLICTQYNYYAQLKGGYWNSKFGQVGCKKVTESSDSGADYGYVSKDGDIWIYTGVTSLNSDSSNIGFILSNERTEETLFIPCTGADEFSAMAAAEGEVQEKGYVASFPSLILVDNNPTYIMVLKDNAGLVKMYAAVNVEQYNLVATATNQEDCIANYKALLNGTLSVEEANSENTEASDTKPVSKDLSDAESKKITVTKKESIVESGNTYIYIVDENNNIYKALYADVIDMILVNVGDTITIKTDGEYFTIE